MAMSRGGRRRSGRALLVAALLGVLTVSTGCGGSEPDTEEAAASSSATGSPSTGAALADTALRLVAIGDSIPFNSPDDCPGCTGFVDRYATALADETGRKVETLNLSQHNSLTLPMLLEELHESDVFESSLRAADAVIVGIAHNTITLNSETPCGSRFDEATSTLEDWSKVTPACARTTAEQYRPKFEQLYSTIASWRSGKPTILLTINKYSDWLGWADAHLTPDQGRRTVLVHDAWNRMLCDAAKKNGFTCVDVYHAFNGPRGTRPAADLLAGDYTHPSNKGNARIADLLVSQGFAPIA